MQGSPATIEGRFVKILNFAGEERLRINLDLLEYKLSRNSSLKLCVHKKFIAVADSKTVLLFNNTTGQKMVAIDVPKVFQKHLSKNREKCGSPDGMSKIVFHQDRLIVVRDTERTFPSVVDFYKFW